MFKAQVLLEPSKQLKQVIQIEHNIIKDPNWPEASYQLVIYKRGRGFELGATEKQIQVVARAELEPEPRDCESDTLTTPPRCLWWLMTICILKYSNVATLIISIKLFHESSQR